VEGSCEHSNELSGCLKRWEVLESSITGGSLRRAQFRGVRDVIISLLCALRPVAADIQHAACSLLVF
jgi:hypothetical protein